MRACVCVCVCVFLSPTHRNFDIVTPGQGLGIHRKKSRGLKDLSAQSGNPCLLFMLLLPFLVIIFSLLASALHLGIRELKAGFQRMNMETIGEYGTLVFQLGLNPSLDTRSHLTDFRFPHF